MDDVERVTFLQNTKGAFVLFDSKIVEYLKKLHDKSTELHLYQSQKRHEDEAEILKWLGAQLKEIDLVFNISSPLFNFLATRFSSTPWRLVHI